MYFHKPLKNSIATACCLLMVASYGASAETASNAGSIEAEEFQPRSTGSGTLFTRLESSETGIDFQIDINSEHELRAAIRNCIRRRGYYDR